MKTIRTLLAGFVIASAAPSWIHAALNTACAVVKLEISQQATLEREAFDANLQVNNTLPNTPLSNFKVVISISDQAGNPAENLFFLKVNSLQGVSDVDGGGVVQPNSTADIHWLIIPSTGAGGTTPNGQKYAIRAVIEGLAGPDPQNLTTYDAFIYVKPQPELNLEYALPYEIFGDEPLTQVVESSEPFHLAVRVTNAGFGPAKNFQIESAQPKIVENLQQLSLNVNITGTYVDGKSIPNTLLIPFGNVQPGQSSIASWILSSNLSGRFVDFSSSFTHSAELGGRLTSLIKNVTTTTLLKPVLANSPGRDNKEDLLVSISANRSALQQYLDNGNALIADAILESDQTLPTPVATAQATLLGSLGGTSSSLTVFFLTPPPLDQWVHVAIKISGPFVPSSIRRSDGKLIDPRNYWISKHFRKSDMSIIYHFNMLDYTPSTPSGNLSLASAQNLRGAASNDFSYTLTYDPKSFDLPPAAITDLTAIPGNGTLELHWTAPGEDGYSGSILGGQYLIQTEQNPNAVFDPSLAQIKFSTSTSPGNLEGYLLKNLSPNASYYVRIWASDTGKSVSSLSNSVTTYILPPPPDTAPPAVAILSPADGAQVSGTVTISGTAQDNDALTKVSIKIDTGNFILLSGLTDWSFDLDTLALSNGLHSVTVRAEDANFNTADASLSLNVQNAPPPDTIPPTVVIRAPSSGADVTGLFAITGTAQDNVALSALSIQIDNHPFMNVPVSSTWSYIYDSAALSTGIHSVTAQAVDTSSNTALSAMVLFNVRRDPAPDTTPPALAISSPAGGSTISGYAVLTVPVSDDVGVTRVDLDVDGVLLYSSASSFVSAVINIPVKTYDISNGSRVFKVTAYDASGNHSQASVTLNVANVPVAQVFSPDGKKAVLYPVVVTPDYWETYVRVQNSTGGFLSESEVPGYFAVPPGYFFALSAASFSPSGDTLILDTYDPFPGFTPAKLAASKRLTWTLNPLTGRALLADIHSKIQKLVTSAVDVPVIAEVSRSTFGPVMIPASIIKVEFYVDGALTSVNASPSNPCIFNWDSDSAGNGKHELMAKVYDNFGNVAQDRTTVYSLTPYNPAIPFINSVEADSGTVQTGTDLSLLLQGTGIDPAGLHFPDVSPSVNEAGLYFENPNYFLVKNGNQTAVIVSGTLATYVQSLEFASGIPVLQYHNINITGLSVAAVFPAPGQTPVYYSHRDWTDNAGVTKDGKIALQSRYLESVVLSTGQVEAYVGDVVFVSPPPPDTTLPSIVISTPANNAVVTGLFTIAGTAQDNAALSAIYLQIDSSPFISVPVSSAWTFDFDPVALSSGFHTLTARAVDTSFNVALSSSVQLIVVKIPTPPPAGPAVYISNLVDGSTVSGITSISGTAQSDVAVLKVEIRLDSAPYFLMSGTTQWSLTGNSALVANGLHTVTVRATDANGATASASLRLNYVNGNASNLTILSPANGSTVSGFGTLSGVADASIVKVEVRVDSAPYYLANGTTNWYINGNSAYVPNGPHLLTVRASDANGNFSYAYLSLIYDNIAQLHAAPASSEARAVKAGESADPSFVLGEVFSYPNPARGVVSPTLRVRCGLADSVQIKIYDISGQRVHDAEITGSAAAVINGQYAYDYSWDARDMASGVYIYTVTAKKSGFPDIRVIKKLALIK